MFNMFEREMTVESYSKKMDALAERVYQALTKDGGMFLMDPAPDCLLTVNFFAALAELEEVDQVAMASLFKETYQKLDSMANDSMANDSMANDSSDDEWISGLGGIGGLLTKLIQRRETLKEAEEKAKALASQAKTRIPRSKIYKNCLSLVDSLVGGDAIRMVVLGA